MPPGSLKALVAGAVAVLMLGGCATTPEPSRNEAGFAEASDNCPARPGRNLPLTLNCFKFPGETSTAYEQASAEGPAGKAARNRLAALLIRRSDDLCVEWLGRLARETFVTDGLDILERAGPGASRLVDGGKSGSVLAAPDFLAGKRGRLDKQVMRNMMGAALMRAIQVARAGKREEILAELEKDSAAYSVNRMIADAHDYHQLCSPHQGLAFVMKALERAARERNDEPAAPSESPDR